MSPILRTTLSILALTALGAASCSTAGGQLEDAGTTDLPFAGEDDDREQPVTEPEPEEVTTTTRIDPAVAGPTFETEPDGLTVAVAGDDGVWWLDPNGKAHLVVEAAVIADYDGTGGLVFQRSTDGPIVRRDAAAVETDVAEAGSGERISLVGVESIGGANEVVFLRTNETSGSASLERVDLGGENGSVIADVARDGEFPERISINGGYVSAVYLEGSGAGWTTVSLASGQKLFGTPEADLGTCDERSTDCTEAVTIGSDGATVFQVAVAETETGFDLVLNSASNFAELTRVDLERPADGWYPTRVDIAGGKVVVSRAANADGSGDLPALVIEPSSGTITQLDRPGYAVVIAG